MTELERRAILRSHGFDVMAIPYLGELFYMRRLLPDGSWDQKQRDGRQYSIDLATGRWSLWGVGTYHEFDELLRGAELGLYDKSIVSAGAAGGTADVQLRNTVSQSDLHPWLVRCQAAGFELVGEVSRVGNCFALHDGVRYLLTTDPEGIVDCRFEDRRIEEFTNTGKSCIGACAGGAVSTVHRESVPPRPSLAEIVFDDRPVLTSGRALQTSLFS